MTPQRVLSLLPAATEIIAALGAWERLVGVTHECDYPPLAITRPRVTASRIDAHAASGEIDAATSAAAAAGLPLFVLDTARIRALAPDCIITQALCDVCAVSEDDVRALAASMPDPPAIVTLDASTFDDVLASIAQVAAALDLEEEGEELLAGVSHRLRRVHHTLKAARAPRPRAAIIEWTDPLYGAGHWVPDMVHRAGGIDAMGKAGAHSQRLDADQVRASAPDVLVFAPCGFAVPRAAAEAQALLARDEWAWARDLPAWAIDGNALTSRPGPRLCDGVETLARIFNPSLFSPVSPAHACRVTPP